jgi:hypothetical protein
MTEQTDGAIYLGDFGNPPTEKTVFWQQAGSKVNMVAVTDSRIAWGAYNFGSDGPLKGKILISDVAQKAGVVTTVTIPGSPDISSISADYFGERFYATTSLGDIYSVKSDGTDLFLEFDGATDPTAKTAVSLFGVNFPALTNLAQQQATLSLGIAYGCQVYSTDPNNNCRMRNESSVIELSTSSQPLQNLSLTAGGFDDGKLAFGALITVGGVGDSRDVPNLAATLPPTNQEEFDASNDDELYGLDTFLRPGDTSLTISSRNATLDDNIFQAVLFFEGVAVEGATAVTLSDDNSGQTEDTSGSSSGAGAGAGAGAGSGGSGSTGSTHSAPAIHLNLEAKPGDSASGAPVVTGGQGLKPGSTYTLILREPAVSLRSGVVEGSGGFTFRDSLPAGLAPGSYTITLTAVGADGSTLILTQSFTIAADGTFSVVGPVTGKVTPTLASTGLDGPLALGVTSVGAFLLLLGAMLVLARRRAEVTQ